MQSFLPSLHTPLSFSSLSVLPLPSLSPLPPSSSVLLPSPSPLSLSLPSPFLPSLPLPPPSPSLLVSCLKCEAHCDISHNELVLLQFEGKLAKGEFDARAGVIAGSILMEEVTVNGQYCQGDLSRGAWECLLTGGP